MEKNKPLVLLILDGWGHAEPSKHNAIALAQTPQWDLWWKTAPHLLLEASGCMVGLPDAQMGNSEVGHMHMGAGRMIPQDLTRINHAIDSGEFHQNPLLQQLIQETKSAGRSLHVMGLLSPGGVHSHQEHLFAFLSLCHQYQFSHVCLHLFLDGRDTPPQSAKEYLKQLNEVLIQYPVGRIASLTGRYFAMDRDQRWERIEAAYRLLTEEHADIYPEHSFLSAEKVLDHFYHQGISDEFIPPTPIGQQITIQDGDSLFFLNFRADRARQLTTTFLDPTFQGFLRRSSPQLNQFITMTDYGLNLTAKPAFPAINLTNSLGEVLANAGLSQLRLAETEKYAHVTFFFNGGTEQIFPHEERILIPSPKVATYDLQPRMSADALTDALVQSIQNGRYDVIICNYANADMVGHTGNLTATIEAIECLDQCLKRVGQAIKVTKGTLIITADHGNAECMFDLSVQQAHTAHTSSLVPFVLIDESADQLRWKVSESTGSLIDIAPTILTLLGIELPQEMSGKRLVLEKQWG